MDEAGDHSNDAGTVSGREVVLREPGFWSRVRDF
jgi:hypothetical protein